jgi:hypothetical protein
MHHRGATTCQALADRLRADRAQRRRVARPEEHTGNGRRTTAIQATVLVLLIVGAAAYLVLPDRFATEPPVRSVEAYCSQVPGVAGLDEAFAELDAGRVRATLPTLEQLEQVSPPDIQPRVKALLDTSRSLVRGVAEARTDESAALDRAWRPKQSEVAAIRDAGVGLQLYTMHHCKLDLVAAR